jgi:lipopolysaccharide export system protein LptA
VRFTIERIRTLVLAAGVLLVVALGVFLAIGRFKSPFSRRDIPKRLGIDIEQEANGVTYTQAHGGHTLFKIHASKVVQLKNDHALLHDVRIELYGADGSRVDSIEGNEFEYDQKAGTATASGPVEMTLTRPGEAAAVLPQANPQPAAGEKSKSNPLTAAAQTAARGEIHVKTSGLTFDQQSGVVTATERVDFSMIQGSGSSVGASYDSQQGFLVLNRDVDLIMHPAASAGSGMAGAREAGTVEIHAAHAEFYTDTNLCNLRAASADYRGSHAMAAQAQIIFRDDGTAVRLEATGGFSVATAAGGHLTAPVAAMDFDEHNQPRHGHLEGGVTMDSVSGARTVHGTAPTMEIEFTPQGGLRHAHLERGVVLRSEETNQDAAGVPVHVSRTWRSPVADVEFRPALRQEKGRSEGKIEPATMHGYGGVTVSGMSQRGNAAPAPSRLAADEVSGEFGPDSTLTAITGLGHASLEQTTAAGAHEMARSDQLEAHFAPPASSAGAGSGSSAKIGAPASGISASQGSRGRDNTQIQSAVLEGHVVLIEQPAAKPGAPPQPEMQATASRADYEEAGLPPTAGLPGREGEWMQLTGSPRVADGGLELTADQIDVSRTSGEAFARGNVKGTWTNDAPDRPGAGTNSQKEDGVNLGGQGPAHVVAAEAELHQATGEAIFRGNARLWQQANAVDAPVIALSRQKQTLVARGSDAAHPVTAVLVSAGGLGAGKQEGSGKGTGGKPAAPSVVRMRGGELWYSGVERRAVMRGGILGTVTAETGTATSVSNEVELQLARAASRPSGQAPTGQVSTGKVSAGQAPAGRVESMTATGHVVVSSQGRRGTGEQLVYSSEDGDYRLTGTAAALPRMTDPERGSVTGEALIFNSRDDSVSIEGGAQKTRTETTAPR